MRQYGCSWDLLAEVMCAEIDFRQNRIEALNQEKAIELSFFSIKSHAKRVTVALISWPRKA